MTASSIRTLIPPPIRRPLGLIWAAARRLVIWRKVAARIAGVTEEDRAVIARAIRRAPFTVWHNLDQWQFPMVDGNCTVISKGAGRFRIRARTDDLFHVLPGQQPAVERAIREALRPGDTFIDAGSNIGYYTILAARLVGSNGRVIACEMMPETAKVLRDHVAMNDAPLR